MTEKVIALDIGNVCIGIHPERCFGALGFAAWRIFRAKCCSWPANGSNAVKFPKRNFWTASDG
ncbi:MAG: hypothetical protein V8T86_04875 [Victivallis sp.]